MKTSFQRSPVNVSLPTFGISAFTSQHAVDFCIPFGSSAFDKLCFVESGCGELQHEGGALEIAKGDLVRVPAELQHRFVDRPGTPMTLSVLCVEASALTSPASVHRTWRELQAIMPFRRRLHVPNAYFHGEYRRLFRSIVFELGTNRTGREAAVFALATQLIILVRRTAEGQVDDRAVSHLTAAFLSSVAELEERFAEPLQISDLADNAGMSYRSYTHNFRSYKGMTVRQYITHLRIEFAKRRIVETGDILGSALESGFGDLGHFYRVFKRHVGCTPQEFIRDQTNGTGS